MCLCLCLNLSVLHQAALIIAQMREQGDLAEDIGFAVSQSTRIEAESAEVRDYFRQMRPAQISHVHCHGHFHYHRCFCFSS